MLNTFLMVIAFFGILALLVGFTMFLSAFTDKRYDKSVSGFIFCTLIWLGYIALLITWFLEFVVKPSLLSLFS